MESWSKRTVLIILIFIVLVGTILRIYNLDKESFWTDEAFSVHHAQEKSISEVITKVSETEAAPPLYYVLLHVWTHRFGNSESAVRSMSVFFGILSIAVLFLTVRLLLTVPAALLSSLFLATSMLQVEYSQEARIYSLFTFLSLLCAYFFVKVYLSEKNTSGNSQMWGWWYGVSLLFALYTNYMALFLVFFFTLFLVWKEVFSRMRKKWLLTHLFVLIASAPLYWMVKVQFIQINSGLAETLIRKGVPTFLAPLGIFLFVFPIAFFLSLILLFWLFKQYKPNIVSPLQSFLHWLDRQFIYFIIIIGLFYLYISIKPFSIAGIPLIRTPISNSYFLVRHSFFLVPLWYVYLGYKIDQYWRENKKKIAFFGFLIVLMVSGSALYEYYTLPTKTQWREATNFINENSAFPVPLILLDKGGFSNEFLAHYYYPGSGIIKLSWSENRQLQKLSEEEVFGQIGERKELWLVLSKNPGTGYFYRDLLDEHYTRDLFWEGYQIKVYGYATISG